MVQQQTAGNPGFLRGYSGMRLVLRAALARGRYRPGCLTSATRRLRPIMAAVIAIVGTAAFSAAGASTVIAAPTCTFAANVIAHAGSTAVPSAFAASGEDSEDLEALPDPFDDARFFPADVSCYISIVDAGQLLYALDHTAIQPGLSTFYKEWITGAAWRDLAAGWGMTDKHLFEQLLQQRVTLVAAPDYFRTCTPRQAHADGHIADPGSDAAKENANSETHASAAEKMMDGWVICAQVNDAFSREIVEKLDGRVLETLRGVTILSADRGALRLAFTRGRIFIATAPTESFLRSVLSFDGSHSLAADASFRAARSVGLGNIGLFLRRSQAADHDTDSCTGAKAATTGECSHESAHSPAWQAMAARLRTNSILISTLASAPENDDANPAGSPRSSGISAVPDRRVSDSVLSAIAGAFGHDALLLTVDQFNKDAWTSEVDGKDAASGASDTTATALASSLVPFADAPQSLLNELGPTVFTLVRPWYAVTGEPHSEDSEAAADGAATSAACRGVPVGDNGDEPPVVMSVGIELQSDSADDACRTLEQLMSAAHPMAHGRCGSRLASTRNRQLILVSRSGETSSADRDSEGDHDPERDLPYGLNLSHLALDSGAEARIVWSTTQAGGRIWWVASTDPQLQSSVIARLQSIMPIQTSTPTTARGALSGIELARLLDRWKAISANNTDACMREIHGWRELMRHISSIRWSVREPSPTLTQSNITVEWPRLRESSPASAIAETPQWRAER